ncbi:hypothetical protein INCEPTION_8 [Proteus phage vB_PmiS_Inception]|nr:hypothetical protein INCEPTION_8 [Proteus phage vB_PmiS_Inception]
MIPKRGTTKTNGVKAKKTTSKGVRPVQGSVIGAFFVLRR